MPSPLAALLRDLEAVFESTASGWYVFGAQAAILHGAARLTADVDVTVMQEGRLYALGCSARIEGAPAPNNLM